MWETSANGGCLANLAVVELRYTGPFRKALAKLGAQERKRIEAATTMVAKAWGDPHRHSGISIRNIRPGIYEARCGLRLRLLFIHDHDELVFFLFGAHDAVQKWIRNF